MQPEAQVDFVAGLDLGKSEDFTALAVVERSRHRPPPPARRALRTYAVRYLKRWPLRTSYLDIVADVARLVARPPLSWPLLAVDQTGVGVAVVESVRRAGVRAQLRPISITAGSAATAGADGSMHVPKKDLVGVLQLLLQGRRLKIAPLPERDLLVRELDNFRVKLTAAGNETFEAWRERDHDDLVLAVALAVWFGECRPEFVPPSGTIPNPNRPALVPGAWDEAGLSQRWRLNPRYRRRPG